MRKRGTVWIAPSASAIPVGRMVDPATAVFWVSWQDDAPLADDSIIGADAAISWGRERADRVLVRLGHSEETYFSAGLDAVEEMPTWPPPGPPPEGWFTPDATLD